MLDDIIVLLEQRIVWTKKNVTSLNWNSVQMLCYNTVLWKNWMPLFMEKSEFSLWDFNGLNVRLIISTVN